MAHFTPAERWSAWAPVFFKKTYDIYEEICLVVHISLTYLQVAQENFKFTRRKACFVLETFLVRTSGPFTTVCGSKASLEWTSLMQQQDMELFESL